MDSSPMSTFLANARAAVFGPSPAATNSSTLVLGNQSADLDSIVCAVVLSYCYARRQDTKNRVYLPVINLPAVPSSTLWRMRPEFGTALRLAQQYKLSSETSASPDEIDDTQKRLLQHAITIHDLQHQNRTKSWFPEEDSDVAEHHLFDGDVILVDHNAPAIQRLSVENLSNLRLTACIDHHVDESKVPSVADPRIITTGIGSCASLVVQYLRDQNLWPYADNHSRDTAVEARELSILALAPILIDTANLTAPGKVSDTDRQVVSFLEDIIQKTQPQLEGTSSKFDISDYYNQLSDAKVNSLDRLTLEELFNQDYKEWTETASTPSTAGTSKIKIGISCTVKPLKYLLAKASKQADDPPEGDDTNFKAASSLTSAAGHFVQGKGLDMFIIMTAFTAPDGDSGSSSSFHRELFFVPTQPRCKPEDPTLLDTIFDAFLMQHSQNLELQPWGTNSDETKSLQQFLYSNAHKDHGMLSKGHVFVQGALGKSRKAVGPMIREAAKDWLDGRLSD